MAMEQPTTLRVVSAGEIVEAEWTPSGVPGLALVGQPVTTAWRLVHMASGRAVSRSAEHTDPEAVRDLARRIAPLADWTEPNVAVSVPRLRQELERVIGDWQVARPAARGTETPSEQAQIPDRPAPRSELGRDLTGELETLASKLRGAEHERLLLREIVRKLHGAVDKGLFADALSALSQSDREYVRALVDDEKEQDATAVVQAIRRTVDSPSHRTPAVTARPPTRPRSPHFGGPDAAAS